MEINQDHYGQYQAYVDEVSVEIFTYQDMFDYAEYSLSGDRITDAFELRQLEIFHSQISIEESLASRGVSNTKSQLLTHQYKSNLGEADCYLSLVSLLEKNQESAISLLEGSSNPTYLVGENSLQASLDKRLVGYKHVMAMVNDLKSNPDSVIGSISGYIPQKDFNTTLEFKYSDILLHLIVDEGIIDQVIIQLGEQVVPVDGALFELVRPALQLSLIELTRV